MREIKFRAWDNNQKKYEYWSAKENKHDGIFWDMIKRPEFEEAEEYTGLKDRKGVEGCGGDICKDKCGVFTIVWEEECGSWGKQYVGSVGILVGMVLVHSEIIGNKWQNPELLENK